jgi:hypothetical protein
MNPSRKFIRVYEPEQKIHKTDGQIVLLRSQNLSSKVLFVLVDYVESRGVSSPPFAR